MARWPRLAAALLAVAAGGGCGCAAMALGPTPVEARTRADELIDAVAARFGPVQIDPALAALRPKLAKAALVPSRIFNDPTAWTSMGGGERTAEFVGERSAGRYRMGVRSRTATPSRPGGYRGSLRLRALRAAEYEWTLREELAVGAVTAEDLSRALSALFVTAEEAPEAEARTRLREALPRAAAAFGRLFSLEDLRLAHSADGATAVTIDLRVDPGGIERDFPRYARFLRKYASPLRFHAVALDASGARWWEVEASENRLRLRLRVQRGDLWPLEGAPGPMPGVLRVRVDLVTKLGIFRVGFRGLQAEVALTRAVHEKGFAARFHQPPDWQLPFLVEPFLRSSLRRPFEGEGALLRYSARDGGGGPTLLVRDYAIAVRESWIVRWLGGLMGDALSEFRRGVEDEADRFSGEGLSALRADVLALLPPPRAPAEACPGAGRYRLYHVAARATPNDRTHSSCARSEG